MRLKDVKSFFEIHTKTILNLLDQYSLVEVYKDKIVGIN